MKYITAEIAIVILLVIAAFLGYKIYTTLLTPSTSDKTSQNNTPISRALSETEQLTRVKNWSKLSLNEKKRLIQIMEKVGQIGDEIKISDNCQVQPLVLKAKRGASINIVNSDSIEHQVAFLEKISTISAKNTLNLPNNLTVGVTRFGCDGKPSGYILINS